MKCKCGTTYEPKAAYTGRPMRPYGLRMTEHGRRTDYDLMEGKLLKVCSSEEKENLRMVACSSCKRALRASDGHPLDFGPLKDQMADGAGRSRFIYVMDSSGNVYVNIHRPNEIYHSSLMGIDCPVGAGEIAVKDSFVVMINDESGHYAPPSDRATVVKDILGDQGFDTDKILVPKSPKRSPVRRTKSGEVVSLYEKHRAYIVFTQTSAHASAGNKT